MPDLLPPPPKDFEAAKARYLEQWGATYTQNSWLRLYLVLLLVISLGQTGGLIYAVKGLREKKTEYVPVDEFHRLVVVQGRPNERQLKHFLVQFATLHYSRFRATVRNDFPKSLYFLDGVLADVTLEAERKTKVIETFMTDGSDEIEVKVNNVALEEHADGVFQAILDYEKIFLDASSRRENGREKFIGQATFVLKTDIPQALIPVNPIGLTILRFREDRAFEGKKR